MDFLEAWQAWLRGQELSGVTVWGVSVLWWSRFGKMAQAVAGLVVILDLLGPDRLRRRGGRAARRFTARIRYLRLVRAASLGTARELFSRRVSERRRRELPRRIRYVNGVVLLAGVALFGAGLLFTGHVEGQPPPPLWRQALATPVLLAAAGLVFRRFFVTHWLMVIGTVLVWWLPAHLVLRPVAYLLATQSPGHRLRWIALGFFLGGFTFDLLGS
ncbi:hypothetical protein ABT346_14690 [Micromonospora peucetia]|uniref:hypothetical protein n=1 Tax=Micromonospora peucetia TaxID=47871 RepID=UPI00331F7A5D